MTPERHNGWTNLETSKCAMEVSEDPWLSRESRELVREMIREHKNLSEVESALREWVTELVYLQFKDGKAPTFIASVALDLFLDAIDWYEIASAIAEEVTDPVEAEEGGSMESEQEE